MVAFTKAILATLVTITATRQRECAKSIKLWNGNTKMLYAVNAPFRFHHILFTTYINCESNPFNNETNLHGQRKITDFHADTYTSRTKRDYPWSNETENPNVPYTWQMSNTFIFGVFISEAENLWPQYDPGKSQ